MLVQSNHAMKTLRVHVTFTTHCFTEQFGKIPHPNGDPIIDEDTKRPRTFCPVRYGLSYSLPALVNGLSGAVVNQTAAQRNWVYSTTIASPAGPYHIFFEISRSPAHKRTWQDLDMVIESAYPETGSPPAIRGQKPFALLCGETYTGNKKRPKKR